MDTFVRFIFLTIFAHQVAHIESHDHSDEIGVGKDFLENIENEDLRDKVVNILKRKNFVRNRDHLQEHVDSYAKLDLEAAADAELDFQFFNLHDTNKDSKLDGLELLASMMHSLQHQLTTLLQRGMSQQDTRRRVAKATKYLSEMVDKILEEEDLNEDGYLTYTEYRSARRNVPFLKDLENTTDRF